MTKKASERRQTTPSIEAPLGKPKVPTQIEELIPKDFVVHVAAAYEPPRPGKIEKADSKVTQLNSPETLTDRFFNLKNSSVLAMKDIYNDTGMQQGQVSVIRATAPYSGEAYMVISRDNQYCNDTGVSSAPAYYYSERVCNAHYETALEIQRRLQEKYPNKLVLLMTNNMQEVVGVTPPIHHRPDKKLTAKQQAGYVLLGRSVNTTKTIALPHTHIVVFDRDDQVPRKFKQGVNREFAAENLEKVLKNTKAVIDSKAHALEKRVIKMLVTEYASKLEEEIRAHLPKWVLDQLSDSALTIEASDRPAGYRFAAANIEQAYLIPEILTAHYFAYKTVAREISSIEARLINSEGAISTETISLPEKSPHRNRLRLHHKKAQKIVPQPSFKEYLEILPNGEVVVHVSPLLLEKIGPIESLGVILCRLLEYEQKDPAVVAEENSFVTEIAQREGFATRSLFAETVVTDQQ